ncbi:hypothetical protein AALP_AA6G099100 [Arabis alpina]|uniref:Uncharacterized protein n=1 Tax=Arabis alpina TaxID=50452 RepID=A0A087GN86_ARAAL|nr:hypothetical protein AALP_AA6G099100 [Arabis alpina]
MQRADDASARGSVPDELNEPKGLGDASLSRVIGKVDPVDKKAEKKRIAAKTKAELEAGRIPAFQIGGTCKVLPFEAPVAQSLGVTPPASLPVNSDSVQLFKQLLTFLSLLFLVLLLSLSCPYQPWRFRPSLLFQREDVINTGNRVIGAYEAEASALKEEKQRLEEEVKKRDVHFEAASAEVAKLRALSEKSCLTEDRFKKERDEARRRADDIASGSSARSAKHSSRLERIRSYLVALHAQEKVKAQLCYRHGARISLEKMVEAEYELPPGLLENYAKEEEEYLAMVESFDADSLDDDILFPTPPPPLAGLLRDVASQVPERISEHGSFLSPQDNQDSDQV